MNPTDRELPRPAAWCDPSNPFNREAFAWDGMDREVRHYDPLYTADQMRAMYHHGREDGRAVADVREMKTSAGSDFYVCVQVGSRYLTPSKYREKWQADFDAAEWNALFTGGERPDVLAFGPPAALEAE